MTFFTGMPVRLSGELASDTRFRKRKTRYFRLVDGVLYGTRRKNQNSKWSVSVVDSTVTASPDSCELVVKLYDGRVIRLNAGDEETLNVWSDKLQVASSRKMWMHYRVGDMIGCGSYASVHIGHRKENGAEIAVKIVQKNRRDKELMMSVENELNVWERQIEHENIVTVHDVFNTQEHLFLVMEFLSGGELYSVLRSCQVFTEVEAATVMNGLLAALEFLHEQGIVHRDVKPENLLCTSRKFPFQVKLTDFGLSAALSTDDDGKETASGMYGTPFFVAPEVIRGEPYDVKVDLWSAGVTLYNMLTGELPFAGNSMRQVLKSVLRSELNLEADEVSHVSQEGKDFLLGLMDRNADRRMSAAEALHHPWLVHNLARARMESSLLESSTNNLIRDCDASSVTDSEFPNCNDTCTSVGRSTVQHSSWREDVLDIMSVPSQTRSAFTLSAELMGGWRRIVSSESPTTSTEFAISDGLARNVTELADECGGRSKQ
mmetsp:Transcript_12431/g.37927  ORF Transcript_12431/g.37927 Transcript_12431/m.37927 type:complete len:489 (+) Transcript_12431:209-1675(+)|eukprot:CAMPEP_0198731124 /NCGR_PEP_ID=MMETSP1475-20131203/28238_1 /TAXON_ID= ORGANISM="Unidentified sp., Strain CCMP1999" /NCGR_SAMPLE_ID=MMETSP1475 /ASSEMBLY_ACC=CAM_ASM_001111 /LENGTH=488 /DNA_ID=CAMNT_0044494043 /DNA_START=201 /DNA_END=1667 /DNA_ORIENTATION=-